MKKTDLKKRLAAAALIALTTAATVVILPTPASANPSQGYVLGVGAWEDDWTDEGPISSSTFSHNNVVAMWQQILWADGNLPWSGIDCIFGPQTSAATRSWKSARGLPNDGIAGNGAFTTASESLVPLGGNAYRYTGSSGNSVNFRRGGDGIWSMSISGDVHQLGYNFATFDKCA
ncbi:MAG TPA: peptidoglycan-binding domain-containing protein [Actinophytocola sp.]|uniref:peptidoglycan-binding domain-containing protein n=1 Tax=Actinophytocola sp. TaxID=1872138 RepID=UPI002DB8A88C|nr:peptidoglycan-binding domain-containing protein [Actinophytocola sp.]HEU5469257.1 peptidoglycan-binding domain-containing protein [Actinophytocola sp.]